MAKNDDLLKKLRAGNFIEHNGTVMRAINILRHQYIELKSVWRVCAEKMSEQEFLDCINFLSQERYISLRDTDSKAEMKLADADYTTLEALVTGRGIRLLGGKLPDDMVDI